MYRIKTPAGGEVDPPRGRCWAATEPEYLKLLEDTRVYFPNDGDVFDAAAAASWRPGRLHPGLSWTHCRALLKVDRREARDFYEPEAVRSGWSARQLERQISSLLFDRLLKSRDRDGVLALANQGHVVSTPNDAIKDPYVLEFLDLPPAPRLSESDLEAALLSQLQAFLLELGNGFAFVGSSCSSWSGPTSSTVATPVRSSRSTRAAAVPRRIRRSSAS